MRDIATAATGNAHLGEKLRATLVDRDITLVVRAGTRDRSEESRRAPADNDDLLPAH